MLIHTRRRWPNVVTGNLGTYALLMDNKVMNRTPRLQSSDKKIPQVVFSGSQVDPNSKHWKTFICLIHVIYSPLQATQTRHKCSEQGMKGGSILRKITNTLQECGAGTTPKYRIGQPKISRKVWYTIPESGTGVTIIAMETEGRVHLPKRRHTTKRKYYSDVEKRRNEFPA